MNELKYQMSRSSNHMSDHKGASLFPSGLLMYDLPSLRRTASRASNNVELINRQSPSPRKRSPSPVPSVSHMRKKELFSILEAFHVNTKPMPLILYIHF